MNVDRGISNRVTQHCSDNLTGANTKVTAHIFSLRVVAVDISFPLTREDCGTITSFFIGVCDILNWKWDAWVGSDSSWLGDPNFPSSMSVNWITGCLRGGAQVSTKKLIFQTPGPSKIIPILPPWLEGGIALAVWKLILYVTYYMLLRSLQPHCLMGWWKYWLSPQLWLRGIYLAEWSLESWL